MHDENQITNSLSNRNQLYIPEVVSPGGLMLTAAPGTTDIGGGIISATWEFNGNLPGPTIKTNTGTIASILFQNNLPEESIVHWHGLIVNKENDGHPQDAVSSGGNYSYNFPIIQRAGLNWYHPHPDMLTGKQVFMGLAGAFIVNDAEESAFNLPSGNFEVPLIIRDVTLNNGGNINYQPTAGGMFGRSSMVNGSMYPYMKVASAVYRFRILNGANARVMNLAFTKNAEMILIGNDGGLLPSSSIQNSIVISNGERLDILVDFRKFKTGESIILRDLNAQWDLVEFIVTEKKMPLYNGALSTSSNIQPLSNPVVTRTFSFDGMSRINGLEFNMNRIDWTVPLHQTEMWVFVSNGNGPHPVHVHGASFQVVSRTGGRGRIFPWEAGWKDTVLLDDGETVRVLIRFDNYSGIYLMHCHKLEHEDRGMMANFEVI
ncbi:MAG: multicopper oxidase domain-containing protein [Ignavibacteria bacterium]|nr:multicopper oxidase domain-containing protein [Ignavibacteria bacterium]